MTYDNSQEMWDMYSWATSIFEREWNYTISRTDDQTKKGKTDNLNVKGSRSKGKEIFILNYTSVGQLEIFLLGINWLKKATVF